MKTRLLIVTDEMEVGGSQRQIFNILSNLDKHRFEPTLLYFREESYLLTELQEQGIECVKISKKGAVDPVFILRLIRFLHSRKFDVVHAFAFSAELWTAIALIFNKARFISSIRGRYEWYSTKHWKLKGWISKRSTRVVSNSESGLLYAEQQCALDRTKAVVIYNGIGDAPDTENSEVLVEFRKQHSCLIAFVGRLVDHKNLHCLLRAAKLLQDAGEDAGFLLVGDGPLRNELMAKVENEVIANVYFLGERDDVHAIFQACDIAVLPSFREGFSNTVLEAMRAGTPMVASRVGGTPEIIQDNLNGMLFDSDKHQQLADKLNLLVRDSGLAKRIGDQGRETVNSRFSIPHMIEQIQTIYEAG